MYRKCGKIGEEYILEIPAYDSRNWDFEYTCTVQKADDKLVTIYCYTTTENPEQQIAATIWDSDESQPIFPYLIEGGLMTPDEPWFRDMWLYYARNLHVWGSEPIEWRGPCHHSTLEAMSKGLAAMWYPDIPEAEHWKRYSELVSGDFWKHKDVPQNDTGYMMGPIVMMICVGDQVLGDDR